MKEAIQSAMAAFNLALDNRHRLRKVSDDAEVAYQSAQNDEAEASKILIAAENALVKAISPILEHAGADGVFIDGISIERESHRGFGGPASLRVRRLVAFDKIPDDLDMPSKAIADES